MHIPRLLISALRGGAGKTLLSLGLTRAFARAGHRVKAYKKGPDYIDAAWLSQAARCECTNLDPFFLPAERLQSLFVHSARAGSATLALMEGNRGLFDGRDVVGSCSSAELARALATPVLLSLDCTKMTRTAAAVVAGLAHFEPGVRLGGVVLNQLGSARHESIIRQSMEQYTDIPVLGAFPRLRHNPLPERHMGLVASGLGDSGAGNAAEEVLEKLADLCAEHLDLQGILALAESAASLAEPAPFWTEEPMGTGPHPRIGYVRDAALWFYYAENLEALERAGAELVPLSLFDPTPWPSLHGLYLGGGYPEEHAEALAHSVHLADIRQLSHSHAPVYAECGGFMLLSQSIMREGQQYLMAGLFPVSAHFHPRPQGLGYVEARVTAANIFHPEGALLRGHEFHYSRCHSEGAMPPLALQLDAGTGMGHGLDGLYTRQTFASYTHIYAPAAPWWAENFVAAARIYAGESADA